MIVGRKRIVRRYLHQQQHSNSRDFHLPDGVLVFVHPRPVSERAAEAEQEEEEEDDVELQINQETNAATYFTSGPPMVGARAVGRTALSTMMSTLDL